MVDGKFQMAKNETPRSSPPESIEVTVPSCSDTSTWVPCPRLRGHVRRTGSAADLRDATTCPRRRGHGTPEAVGWPRTPAVEIGEECPSRPPVQGTRRLFDRNPPHQCPAPA